MASFQEMKVTAHLQDSWSTLVLELILMDLTGEMSEGGKK